MASKTLGVRQNQRGALRGHVTKESRKAALLTVVASEADVEAAQGSVAKLIDYRARLGVLNEEIALTLETETAIGEDIQKSSDIDDQILDTITTLNAKLNSYKSASAQQAPTSPNVSAANSSFNQSHGASVKLPVLEIKKFGGDPLKWDEFWDSFTATIHDHPNLSTIDKYKYLRGFLAGDAFRVVDGYRLTAENYMTVVEALTERFGNKQIAIFSHFEAMLALPVMTTHDTPRLQSTYDECERHIRSLIALGLQEDTFGQVFTPIILSKLPTFVKMELYRKNGSQPWTLNSLRELLKDEIRARDLSQRTFGPKSLGDRQQPGRDQPRIGPQSFSSRQHRGSPSSSASFLTNSANNSKPSGGPRCAFCNGSHFSDKCAAYPDVTSRRDQMRGRCYCCLNSGHMVKLCPNRRACFHCKKEGHHQSLCLSKFGAKSEKSKQDSTLIAEGSVPSGTATPVNTSLLSHGEHVVLQTALASVKGSQQTKARFLFDTGCSRTFVAARVAKQIGARTKGSEFISTAGFSETRRRTGKYDIVEFDVVLGDGSLKTVTANVIEEISCPIQKVALDPAKYPLVKQLVLAEPIVNQMQMVPVDVLIGIDYYYEFVGCEQIKCPDGLMFLASSLGFIATGKIDAARVPKNRSLATMHLTANTEVNVAVERFWSLEDIGVKPPSSTNDDEEAVRLFNESVKQVEGRYFVSWPMNSEAPTLPDNRAIASIRLASTLKRIMSDPKVFDTYNQTLLDQESKGIIERVPEGGTPFPVHYIPHHAVITPGKATTKLRVVYDASAKANKNSPSLNDCMFRGPVILDDLCGLIMRFRLSLVGLVSDIEKAFHQVGLHPDSRDVTRFLWIKDPGRPPTGDNVVEFRFARVFFGAVASPFLLAGVVQHHIQGSNSDVASQIRGNIYVDNVITGVSTDAEARKFYREAKELFRDASMNLREWFTNSPQFRESIDPSDRGKTDITKVLGLTWDTTADELSCSSFSADADSVVTKRVMLKCLASVFDPSGYFSPVTVVGKMLIQKLWSQKHDWDDRLPGDIIDEWRICSKNLQQIPNHSISRYIGTTGNSAGTTYQLHVFCDASAKAYAAVVYLRTTTSVGVQSNLVFAKSRVAPIKSMTIPRLELMALLIGTRLIQFVAEQLRLPIEKKVVWSDSQCVLHWQQKKTITTLFVRNRIEEINSHDGLVFRYVPTSSNPADLPSRGCSTDSLVSNKGWWSGPDWLGREVDWPANIDGSVNVLNDGEVLLPAVSNSATDDDPEDKFLSIERFSRLTRLLRVTSWILRFVNNCRGNKRSGPLAVDELSLSQVFWENRVQRAHFSDVLAVRNGSKMPLKYKDLQLFVDAEGFVRCGGRLRFADIGYDAKYPKLLPKNNHFTDLVIDDVHRRLCHAGTPHTLSQIRYKYWVVSGRSQVKRLIKSCMTCRIAHGGCYREQPMPPLPEFRVKRSPPFSCVGIDYLGPLLIKPKGQLPPTKVWICLFTCAVTRAVHLEVVDQMTAQQFVLCLRRFFALFGKPRLIISDNAKHFIATDVMFSKLWLDIIVDPSVHDFAATRGIEWKFITELSPWMGGFYERMVGIVKSALKKSFDSKCVSLIELQTIVTEVVAVVNSRPLVYPDSDLSEPPLTPAHFLGGPKAVVPQFCIDGDEYKQKLTTPDQMVLGWKRLQGMLDTFWRIWRDQYLLELRSQSKIRKQRKTSSDKPTVGAIVLVKDQMPRNSWKLAKIVALKLGVDGHCRSVTLELPNKKLINRPLRLLFPLEMNIFEGGRVAPLQNIATLRPKRAAAVGAMRAITCDREGANDSDEDSGEL